MLCSSPGSCSQHPTPSVSLCIHTCVCHSQVSDKMEPAEIVSLVATLNPTNEAGRLAIIVRMGPAKVRTALPALIKAINDAGLSVTWVCDPMHGNTESVAGYKTRRYENIRAGGWTRQCALIGLWVF